MKWSEYIKCSFDGINLGPKIWHGAVSRRKNSYCFVFISEMKNSKQIFYSISEDGQFFSKPQILIKISKEWKYFLSTVLFRIYCRRICLHIWCG